MNHQDNGTIIISFLLLLPWIGRTAVSAVAVWREHIETRSRKAKRNFQSQSPRKLCAGFAHYLNERPEMSFR